MFHNSSLCSSVLHVFMLVLFKSVVWGIDFFMKLFKTSNIQMVNDCQVYFGFDLLSVIIDRQSKKFLSANVNVS